MSMPSVTPGEEEGTGGVVMATSIGVRTIEPEYIREHTRIATVEHVVREESSPRSWQLGTKSGQHVLEN